MKSNEQGVLQKGKLINLPVQFLLLVIFLTHNLSTETLAADTLKHEKTTQKQHVFISYSQDNALLSNIAQTLSDNLSAKLPDIIISNVSPDKEITDIENHANIVIGIGSAGISNAKRNYPKTNKLFISTDPEKFKLDKNTNKNDAVLYMTQSYCRQIQFIKLINHDWKVISLLNSQNKPVDTKKIQRCANKYGITIYTVNTSSEGNMTDHVKDALKHSDALLALPDKNIYNSHTVKNILLTSYRHRKPVIAFSKNFVNAGALASIHSSVEHVAHSASTLIEHYFKRDNRFKKPVNHPQSFDISINRQVFRALEIPSPDINKLEQILKQLESGKTGNGQ